MAIYYIDPHTTVNGTGTWASPWSINTAHTGLVAGDEIRIKGIALTSLLTATEYTASVTSNYQLTITAGGGLGADFAANDVCYLPDFDTFFKVASVTTNVIALAATTSMLPINNTATTTVTVRRVNLTSYPAGTTGSIYYLAGAYAATNNISISDCWVDATTRVTDATVKTLLNTTNTTTSLTLYLDSSTTGNPSGWSINLNNTHVLNSNGTSSSGITVRIFASSSTYSINQVFGTAFTSGGFSMGDGSSSLPTGNTITINSFQSGPLFNVVYTRDMVFNINNYNGYYCDYIYNTGGTGLSFSDRFTVNITNIISNTYNSGVINHAVIPQGTINYINGIDLFSATSPGILISGMNGPTTVNFSPACVFKYNKQANTQTNFAVGHGSITTYTGKNILPTFNTPPGCTFTNRYYLTTSSLIASLNRSYMTPMVVNIELPSIPVSTQLPYGNSFSNILVTARDGGSPIEILGILNSSYNVPNAYTNYPNVTIDVTVYKTTGPSLKSYLSTKNALAWRKVGTYAQPVAVKNIKIPVTAGTSYTVVGWVKTNDTAYLTGDCRMAIIHNNSELVAQDMTTACIDAWEQFTLTFTAPQTCEMNLAWEMYYSNGGKSYWLDDLTIS